MGDKYLAIHKELIAIRESMKAMMIQLPMFDCLIESFPDMDFATEYERPEDIWRYVDNAIASLQSAMERNKNRAVLCTEIAAGLIIILKMIRGQLELECRENSIADRKYLRREY